MPTRPTTISRIPFRIIFGTLRIRSLTDIPLRGAWRRAMIGLASGTAKTRRLAENAWWRGDALGAMGYWRELEQAEPGNAAWPLKIAQAATERGDFATAEATLLAARERGIDNEDVDLNLARCIRASRRTNSAIHDAEAILAEPSAAANKVFDSALYLMGQGRLEDARAGFERMLASERHAALAKAHLAAIDLMEEARAKGRPDVPVWVSPAETSVLVREPSSDTLVVAFVLPSSGIGLPTNAVHAMLSSTGVNALYLYDTRHVFHLSGADRFGHGYDAMLDGIRALKAELGVRRLITLGGSATAYTAIRTALDLDADGALTFGGQSIMLADASHGLARSAHTVQRLRQFALPMMKDLRELVLAKSPRPRIEFYYSAGNRRDRMHASNLSGISGVHLNAIPRLSRHNCLAEMARRGYRDLLQVFDD